MEVLYQQDTLILTISHYREMTSEGKGKRWRKQKEVKTEEIKGVGEESTKNYESSLNRGLEAFKKRSEEPPQTENGEPLLNINYIVDTLLLSPVKWAAIVKSPSCKWGNGYQKLAKGHKLKHFTNIFSESRTSAAYHSQKENVPFHLPTGWAGGYSEHTTLSPGWPANL